MSPEEEEVVVYRVKTLFNAMAAINAALWFIFTIEAVVGLEWKWMHIGAERAITTQYLWLMLLWMHGARNQREKPHLSHELCRKCGAFNKHLISVEFLTLEINLPFP